MESESGPLVTAIVPTRNRRAYLKRALDSVSAQSYPFVEVCVVDDASDDGTSEWVRESYPDFHVITLSQNVGAAEARNRGIEIACGEFIAFLDDDDQWPRDFLERHLSALCDATDRVLSFSNYVVRGRDGKVQTPDLRPTRVYSDIREHLVTEFFIHSMSLVVVRASAVKANLLNPSLRIVHDCELYVRLLEVGQFCYLQDSFVIRQAVEDSLATQLETIEREEKEFLDWALERYMPRSVHSRIWAYRSLLFAKLGWDLGRGLGFSLQRLFRAFRFSPFATLAILLKKLLYRTLPKNSGPQITFCSHPLDEDHR
jgi:glycosyltransferase involved in cell wall biosynthesis